MTATSAWMATMPPALRYGAAVEFYDRELMAIRMLDRADGRSFQAPAQVFMRLATWFLRSPADRESLKQIWKGRDRARHEFRDQLYGLLDDYTSFSVEFNARYAHRTFDSMNTSGYKAFAARVSDFDRSCPEARKTVYQDQLAALEARRRARAQIG